MPWTLEFNSVRKALDLWGITEASLSLGAGIRDILTLAIDAMAFDAADLFTNAFDVILRDSADTKRFVGRMIVPDVEATGASEGQVYQFAGLWDKFEQLPFGQPWNENGTFILNSEVFLPARLDGQSVEHITCGDQIREVITFVRQQLGNIVQIGTIVPTLQTPLDQRTDLRCSQVIQMMLGLCPDATVQIDYTTTPPTLHVLQRAQMTVRTIALSSEKMTQLRLRRRDDLVPSRIVIIYKQVNTVDGVSRVFTTRDIFPAAVGAENPLTLGFEYGALVQTVNIYGGQVTTVRGVVSTVGIPDEPDLGFFTERGVQITGTVEGFEYTGRQGDLPYQILPGGGVQPWMEDDDGNPAETFLDTFTCAIKVNNGETSVWREEQVRINTTNIRQGNYKKTASATSAEPIPVGLAQQVYESLQTPFYEGSITLTAEEALEPIRPGDLLNITGGTGRYAAMNALVQTLSINVLTGETTINVGPPRQLTIEQLIDLLRMNRTRRVYTNASVQGTGEISGNDVTFEGDSAVENTTSTPTSFDYIKLLGGGSGSNQRYTILEPGKITLGYGPGADLDPKIIIEAGTQGSIQIKTNGTAGQVLIHTNDTAGAVVRIQDTLGCDGGVNTTKKALRS